MVTSISCRRAVTNPTATMAWSVTSPDGVFYRSGPENTSASISSQVGHERNGVFFP